MPKKPTNYRRPDHVADQYLTDEFKALQRQWYKALAEDGFDDIESGNEFARYLKKHGIITADRYDAVTQEHYRRCRIHLERHDFLDPKTGAPSERDKALFTWYTEGVSYRKMIPLYLERFNKRRSLFYMYHHTKRLLADMEALQYWYDPPETPDSDAEALGDLIKAIQNEREDYE